MKNMVTYLSGNFFVLSLFGIFVFCDFGRSSSLFLRMNKFIELCRNFRKEDRAKKFGWQCPQWA